MSIEVKHGGIREIEVRPSLDHQPMLSVRYAANGGKRLVVSMLRGGDTRGVLEINEADATELARVLAQMVEENF